MPSVVVRLRFSKLGKVRWTSHRDVARMWERAFRRAGVTVQYTGGFSPRPKVSFGLALPTGHESFAEYLDVHLADTGPAGVDVLTLPGRLTPALPNGIDVTGALALDAGSPSLQHEVTSCSWEVELDTTGLQQRIDVVLGAASLMVTRERKGHRVTDDIRPAIRSLAVAAPASGGGRLVAELATQPRGLRPAELLGALDVDVADCLVRRTHQWIERDGARVEPVSLDATGAPHAGARAS